MILLCRDPVLMCGVVRSGASRAFHWSALAAGSLIPSAESAVQTGPFSLCRDITWKSLEALPQNTHCLISGCFSLEPVSNRILTKVYLFLYFSCSNNLKVQQTNNQQILIIYHVLWSLGTLNAVKFQPWIYNLVTEIRLTLQTITKAIEDSKCA